MEPALGATVGQGVLEQPEELLDSRAQDEAYQQLMRERTEQARLEARLEQRGGAITGGEDALDEVLNEPDTAPPGTSQGRLAAGRRSAQVTLQRVQQARKVAQAVQGAAATAKKVRWLVVLGEGTIALLANPYTWIVLLLAPVVLAVGYCAQPDNAGDCSALLGAVLWQNVKSVFGVKEDTKSPATSDPTPAVGSPAPGSQDASDTGSATPSQLDATPIP